MPKSKRGKKKKNEGGRRKEEAGREGGKEESITVFLESYLRNSQDLFSVYL